MDQLRTFFHRDQLLFAPKYEWVFGEKIDHPETITRTQSILNALQEEPEIFEFVHPESFELAGIKAVHSRKLFQIIKNSSTLNIDQCFYPNVFPYFRDRANIDTEIIFHSGAFCFDSGTPLTALTYSAACWSATCAFEAAIAVRDSKTAAYALCRPPGHHASKDLFGGYCYFNNAAVAATELKKSGRVAVLDIDFHHGNGTQTIFYRDPQVLVVNIHGDPRQHYPYFTGYASERGEGAGAGTNYNFPLGKACDGKNYLEVLSGPAFTTIRNFSPDFLVLSAGFDTYVGDPIGAFCLQTVDFKSIGEQIRSLDLPTVIVQEGGYASDSLGHNVKALLKGFMHKTE